MLLDGRGLDLETAFIFGVDETTSPEHYFLFNFCSQLLCQTLVGVALFRPLLPFMVIVGEVPDGMPFAFVATAFVDGSQGYNLPMSM